MPVGAGGGTPTLVVKLAGVATPPWERREAVASALTVPPPGSPSVSPMIGRAAAAGRHASCHVCVRLLQVLGRDVVCARVRALALARRKAYMTPTRML
jgi:hypothetical protein